MMLFERTYKVRSWFHISLNMKYKYCPMDMFQLRWFEKLYVKITRSLYTHLK